MSKIESLYRDAPENPGVYCKGPSSSQLGVLKKGVRAAYRQAGLRPSILDEGYGGICPGIVASDGHFQLHQRKLPEEDSSNIAFRASDLEDLQVVEGLVVVWLGKVTDMRFQTYNNGEPEDFLFAKASWNRLAGVILEGINERSFEPVERNQTLALDHHASRLLS